MKHISKFDRYEYEIAYSIVDEDGCPKYEDITLIWRDAPCGVGQSFLQDIPPRELVGWYWGEYDFETVEEYIKDYWKKKLSASEQPKVNPSKTMDLPIAYVNFISDCLETIKKCNLYALLGGCDAVDLEQDHLEEVLEMFCKPLEKYGDDTVIILED